MGNEKKSLFAKLWSWLLELPDTIGYLINPKPVHDAVAEAAARKPEKVNRANIFEKSLSDDEVVEIERELSQGIKDGYAKDIPNYLSSLNKEYKQTSVIGLSDRARAKNLSNLNKLFELVDKVKPEEGNWKIGDNTVTGSWEEWKTAVVNSINLLGARLDSHWVKKASRQNLPKSQAVVAEPLRDDSALPPIPSPKERSSEGPTTRPIPQRLRDKYSTKVSAKPADASLSKVSGGPPSKPLPTLDQQWDENKSTVANLAVPAPRPKEPRKAGISRSVAKGPPQTELPPNPKGPPQKRLPPNPKSASVAPQPNPPTETPSEPSAAPESSAKK
jgi:hypothetical protein